jgi:phage/plasmid-associated DNA primase
VVRATEQYLDQQDNVGTWISECCTLAPDARESAKELYQSYCDWARAAGIPLGRRHDFIDGLRKRHGPDGMPMLLERRTELGSTFFGIHVTPTMTGHNWDS